MSPTSDLLLAVAVLLGHVSVWTWIYNRLHASGLPSRVVHRLEKWVIIALLVTGCGLLAWIIRRGPDWMTIDAQGLSQVVGVWRYACWVMLAYVIAAWLFRQLVGRDSGRLVTNDTERLDVERILGYRPIGDFRTRMWGAVPGNQILHVRAHHKVLRVAHLPPELDGLRIAQVTDLHMTGQLTRAFFDVAIAHTNRWRPELVMITGDLVDDPACVAWVPETLGRLQSRYGTYAILGNHDQRLVDVARLRRTLTDNGIEDLGGRCVLRPVRGVCVLLAGNEHPWFPAPPRVELEPSASRPFSILLSHSPDQLPWARRHGFQLMLTGHTHGGQIRVPGIGPIICPSRYGVWYASGLFDRPPTLMHVSRGLSGVHPLRFNCPPELTLLELRRET
jgi:predicted MPP superfamily phosphohydrolase